MPVKKQTAAQRKKSASTAAKAQRKVEIAMRRARVANLTLAYIPQQQIATEMGVSAATISNDLKAIKLDWQRDARVDVQAKAVKELRSLDRLESRLWQQIGAPGLLADELTRTAMAILKVKERRAKMLGFDQPDLLEIRLTAEMVENEIIRYRQELGYDGPAALPA